jgi:hypothetical protein
MPARTLKSSMSILYYLSVSVNFVAIDFFLNHCNIQAPKNQDVLITEDSMKYANKRASDLNDERIRAVMKALEGFSISDIQEKSRDSSKSKPSKNKLNGLYRDAFLKVLSLRESKIV